MKIIVAPPHEGRKEEKSPKIFRCAPNLYGAGGGGKIVVPRSETARANRANRINSANA